MVYSIARLMQLAGLVILPVAVTGNVANEMTLKTSLTLSGVGVGVFTLGWMLQKAVKP